MNEDFKELLIELNKFKGYCPSYSFSKVSRVLSSSILDANSLIDQNRIANCVSVVQEMPDLVSYIDENPFDNSDIVEYFDNISSISSRNSMVFDEIEPESYLHNNIVNFIDTCSSVTAHLSENMALHSHAILSADVMDNIFFDELMY